MAAKQVAGNCYICGTELGKTAMKNHLLKAHNEKESGQLCALLKAESVSKKYWLFIDIPVDKTLSDVDKFLRDIWLECCGHMSAFSGQGHVKINMSRKIMDFAVGEKLLHRYDFGSTTETTITVVDEIYRGFHGRAVRLLARNVPHVFVCVECGKLAKYYCTECAWNWDSEPFFCNSCGETHRHEDMLMPITNSPRMGVCGYGGEYDHYTFIPSK